MSLPSAEAAALGRKVAHLREQRGLSQQDFGALIGRSQSWVSQVERGVRHVDRMSVLENVARALDVPVADLAPDSVAVAATQPPTAATDLALALSSSDALLAVLSGTSTVDVDQLGVDAEAAWQLAHGTHYEDLAERLGSLIPQVEQATRTATGAARKRAFTAKARTYHAAAAALSKLGEPAAAWVAADRAITAAERAGDALLMAEGAFRLAITFQSAQRFELAIRTAETAVAALTGRAGAGDKPALALQGALQLQLAVSSARLNDPDAAYGHIAQAQQAADQVGDGRNDYNTEFGPANVALHEVHVAVELGDAGRALRVADRLDASQLSVERRSRLLVDIARAHGQRRHRGHGEASIAALSEAYDIAPEYVTASPAARSLVQDAIRSGGGDPVPGLHELAAALGITNRH